MSRRGVEFIDIETGENDINHWTRGDCQLGVMPANGLLYTTPHPCGCYINAKLNGYFALAPEQGAGRKGQGVGTLVKGPAYSQVSGLKSQASSSWPTFRGDEKRRGFSTTAVSAKPSNVWKTKFASAIGPLSVAGGMVFVPVIDEHRIVALDENTGKETWSYTAGARVDTPPTIHNGLALFGSADGWAYCLRAKDGELVWKRRMAPADRFVGALGQLESAWPVHGSILVKDGTAYLSAGRSSYLDGGIRCFALKPDTGEIVEERPLYNPDPETGKMAHDPKDDHTMPGVLSDILVSDGESVWMREEPVFGEGRSKGGPVYATGGFRDDTWFNRTTWAVGKAKHAQLLVTGDDNAYCIESFDSASRAKAFTPGAQGYRLSAVSLDGKISPERQQTQEKAAGK
jgi:outer membrane protein assembly factor BamB